MEAARFPYHSHPTVSPPTLKYGAFVWAVSQLPWPPLILLRIECCSVNDMIHADEPFQTLSCATDFPSCKLQPSAYFHRLF